MNIVRKTNRDRRSPDIALHRLNRAYDIDPSQGRAIIAHDPNLWINLVLRQTKKGGLATLAVSVLDTVKEAMAVAIAKYG